MPREFNKAVMTNGGADLLNRAQAGNAVLEFTRMAIGDGIYDEETTVEAMQEMTGLKSEKYSYPIYKKSIESRRCLKLTSIFGNAIPGEDTAFVTEGFYINEIGLYCKAKDEDDSEVLYSVTTVIGGRGDYMPPYNGKNRAEIIQDWYATITNDGVAYIQNSGVFVTQEYVDSLMARAIGFDGVPSNVPYDNVQDAIDLIFSGLNAEMIEQAFENVYMFANDGDNELSMSSADIEQAIKQEWNGETSDDETALSSADIEKTLK